MEQRIWIVLLGGGGAWLLARWQVGPSRWLGWGALIAALGFGTLAFGGHEGRWIWMAVFWALTVGAVDDLTTGSVSDWVPGLLTLFGLSWRLWNGSPVTGALEALAGMAVALPLGGLAVRGLMGWGDVLLAAALGCALGWQQVLILLGWTFAIAGTAAVLALVFGTTERDDRWPLAPFMLLGALGAIVTNLWPLGLGCFRSAWM